MAFETRWTLPSKYNALAALSLLYRKQIGSIWPDLLFCQPQPVFRLGRLEIARAKPVKVLLANLPLFSLAQQTQMLLALHKRII
jgi:hypothetical protein